MEFTNDRPQPVTQYFDGWILDRLLPSSQPVQGYGFPWPMAKGVAQLEASGVVPYAH